VDERFARLGCRRSENNLSFAALFGSSATLAGSRAFVGYAGWSGGQLESELQQSAWIVNPATESILGNASNDETWLDLIKISEMAYHLLAIAPDDPSLS
jgi:putative AlgH/UPF0301 family transcriptional regulator